MKQAVVSDLVRGRERGYYNKYILEEVYFSASCPRPGEDDKKNNPQRAHFINGKYYFDFPDLWYNNTSQHKAIGLRRIDLMADQLDIAFKVDIYRKPTAGGITPKRTVDIEILAGSTDTTESIFKEIARELTRAVSSNGEQPWDTDPGQTVKFVSLYKYGSSTATLRAIKRNNGNKYTFGFKMYSFSTGAKALLHLPNGYNETPYTEPTTVANGTMNVSFNCWNREFLFVHASFVTGSSFGYLGRSGEFYPKPSKMYQFSSAPQQFYFELSFDGRTPIDYRVGEFCIDLSYIYYDGNYQAE